MDKAPVEGYRLSPQQERIWELQDPHDPGVYLTRAAILLRGHVDYTHLRGCLERLVARHEILRTTFHCALGVVSAPLQTVGKPILEWTRSEASELETDVQFLASSDVERLFGRVGWKTFDLENGPVLRACALEISESTGMLLLGAPSLCCDALSIDVLARQLASEYSQATSSTGHGSLDAVQYVDFSEWQQEQLSLHAGASEALPCLGEAAVPAPSFSSRDTGVPAPTYGCAERELVAIERNAVDGLSERDDFSAEAFLLTCWALVVSRLTGRSEVVLALRCDGRCREELKDAVGAYEKQIPIQVVVRDGDSFRSALENVRKAATDTRAAQEQFTWSQLQGTSTGLVAFEYDEQEEPAAGGGVSFAVVGRTSQIEPFALRLRLVRSQTSLRAELHFDSSRYSERDASRWLGQFCLVVREAVKMPSRLGDVPVIDDDEQRRLLCSFNDTEAVAPDHQLMHRWLEHQMKSVPDRVAAVSGGHSLTYRELDVRSLKLANQLVASGVGPDVPVALYMAHTVELVIGIAGILRAGGAYVPMDTAWPPLRSLQVLDAVGANVVVTHRSCDGQLPSWRARTVYLDDPSISERDLGPARLAQTDARPESLAYIMHTSGSTGGPKGVMVSHGNLVHSTHARVLRYRDSGPFLLVTSVAFDSSVAGIFGTLCSGRTLLLGQSGADLDLAGLGKQIADLGVSTTLMIPALLTQLLEEVGGSELRSLRDVIVAGEVCSYQTVAVAGRTLPQATLTNEYGPTEATVWATALDCSSHGAVSPVPIGKPVSNTKVYILDHSLRPVPVGVQGELYVAGGGVARGYFGGPKDTASCFVPNHLSGARGERLYRTGDRGSYQADGNIIFHGRLDHQVKVRGLRIELGELEGVLESHADIREAVVIAPICKTGERRLLAYAAVASGRKVEEAELRRFMLSSLPAPVLPDEIFVMDALPRNANGKVDRERLPSRDVSSDGVAPSTETERELVSIWSQLLARVDVGVTDSFFALGGHSLMAISLMARVQKAFRVELRLSVLFRAPTIRAMAKHIDETVGATDEKYSDSLPTITSSPQGQYERFPLTPVQQAYWIGRHQAFELGNVGSTNYFEWDVPELDLDRLADAIHRLIDRHEMLRAVVLPDGYIQVLKNLPRYELDVVDLRALPPDEAEACIQTVRGRMSTRGLEIDRWPTFELKAHRLEESVRLHVAFDLVMFDAVSSNILAQDLYRLYHQPNEPSEPLGISFRDYVVAEVELKESRAYSNAQRYWSKQVETLPAPPMLPVSKSPLEIQRPRFETLFGELERDSWEKLKQRAAEKSLTSTGVLCSAYSDVLATWSKSRQFTLNLTTYHRIPFHQDVDRLVGDFTSLTMLAVNSTQDTFDARARAVQDRLWSDLDYLNYSGVEVLRELRRRQGEAFSGLMPVVFTSQLGVAVKENPAARAWMGELVSSTGQAPQVWLDHQVTEKNGRLSFWWDYLPELFPKGLIQSMFDAYLRLLERLAHDGDYWRQTSRVLVDTEDLEEPVQREMGESSNHHELLHTAVAATADVRSAEPAIITSARTITYAELHRASVALGHRLRRAGAQRNTVVGVLMEKGWEQVVAVLGILHSGAAYLPIDPSLPLERIHYLLEHAQVATVLTQSWVTESRDWAQSVRTIEVDNFEAAPDETGPLPPVQRPEDIAYVIYTSGSTGEPKGVVLSHRAVANTVKDMNRRFAVGYRDRVLALSSLSFDLSVYDIFGPLSVGGALVIPDIGKTRDVAHWNELIKAQKVTIWNSVPALMGMFLSHLEGLGDRLGSRMRLALLSGDWIPVDLPERLRRVADDLEVVGLGGATEAAIWSILYPIKEIDPNWKSIPYGQAMEGQAVEVLDDSFNECPVWAAGELFISGVGLADGYWKDETRTRERFFAHPKTGRRLFRTGDLGRRHPDGNIEFLGRSDHQVKVGGYRIELGEIEAALQQHEKVTSVAVTAVGDRDSKRLIAYVVPNPEAAVNDRVAETASNGSAQLPIAAQQRGLRKCKSQVSVRLGTSRHDAEVEQLYRQRRTHRFFRERPVAMEQLSELLRCLSQMPLAGYALPKYRYASAGSTYAVQTYVCVKPSGVEGVASGSYYYDPQNHSLDLLEEGRCIDTDAYDAFNRPVAKEAGFSIFLVAELGAIAPLYGDIAAKDFCLIEAGYMSQLLMTTAETCGLGLCPIGGVKGSVHEMFQLTESHLVLHSLLGGEQDPVRLKQSEAVIRPLTTPRVTAPAGLSEELRAFVEKKLPSYMVPSQFVVLDRLPLTSNGKLDRSALPAPNDRVEKVEFVPPSTALEHLLVDFWKELLGVDQVGVRDSFFRLGGNSLVAIRVMNKIHTVLQVELPLESFLSAVTIVELAALIEANQSTQSADSLLEKVEALSDEEVKKTLAAKKREAGGRAKGKTPDRV